MLTYPCIIAFLFSTSRLYIKRIIENKGFRTFWVMESRVTIGPIKFKAFGAALIVARNFTILLGVESIAPNETLVAFWEMNSRGAIGAIISEVGRTRSCLCASIVLRP